MCVVIVKYFWRELISDVNGAALYFERFFLKWNYITDQ